MRRRCFACCWQLLVLPGAGADSKFGTPSVTEASATCASVDFPYHGDAPLSEVFLYAKRPDDLEYLQWGGPLRVRKVERQRRPGEGDGAGDEPMYRMLMQHIPPGQEFRVKVADAPHLQGDVSEASEASHSLASPVIPVTPSQLELHRTDPRLNHQMHDSSVCVDLHWAHPHTQLHRKPDDVYFRISVNGKGEPPFEKCRDTFGRGVRNCGTPLASASSELPLSYATLCRLRPNRTLTFTLEAFNCDGQRAEGVITAVTPPTGPAMMIELLTHSRDQESKAGFKPTVIVDWVPQNDPLIEGHALYLGLADVFAVKLICWLPRSLPGHIELPVLHKNDTHSEDALLLRDFGRHLAVHQEQELMVATRTAYFVNGVKAGHLESPMTRFRLGNWLVMVEAVKCLTSFEAPHTDYVAYPVTLSWTEQQALARYD